MNKYIAHLDQVQFLVLVLKLLKDKCNLTNTKHAPLHARTLDDEVPIVVGLE